MNIFPEIIGIQLVNHQEYADEYMSTQLLDDILHEIKRWPTIKIVEIFHSRQEDLEKYSRHINLLASEQIPFKLSLVTHTLGGESIDSRDKETLTLISPSDMEFLDNKDQGMNGSFGSLCIEANSLYITVSGFVYPCQHSLDEHIGIFPESDFGTLINNDRLYELRHETRMGNCNVLPKCNYLSSMISKESLRKFWINKDDREQIDSQEERLLLFNELLQVEHRALRVDLGCGPAKRTGFVGVDRFPLPGVDIIGDLNERLPFEDDTVDLVYASHSLEHVSDLMFTMNEIYRICKHGAQVCIVVPYSEQKLNYANPYHLQVFNEHTPRFWTDYPRSVIPKNEWEHPQAPIWGLSRSDHSDATIDLRCVNMHFDYFPDFAQMSEEEKIAARKTKLDVCEQIMYQLIAIKKGITDEEFLDMVQKTDFYEPPYITLRKQKEENNKLQTDMKIVCEEIERLQQRVENYKVEYDKQNNLINDLKKENNELSNNKYQLEKDVVLLKQEYKDSELKIGKYREDHEKTIKELEALNRALLQMANEKELFKKNKINRIKSLYSIKDMWPLVGNSFTKLKDDSIIHHFKEDKYKLTLSENLQTVPFLHYKLENIGGTLNGVFIALSTDITLCDGNIGVELLDDTGKILSNNSKEIRGHDINEPFHIQVKPQVLLQNVEYYLRVFGVNLEAPVSIYEFARRNKIYKKKTRPFVGLDLI
ncbi:class I SAM-dependent methyltransferase [Paenibacillus sp. J22TS3]|uniref:class I SAM-dependent methyltransferase n=1 Tax=Paenibacillus sp. J22TS3 TaxID=2807192 RepID=UPI001B0A6E3F|nr:class I SAM-dependent methyltransferase [Paenibacillus sp. J22TS3]GIP21687.1 hypothetical protein J22TS3_19620 [Paenibacillus sp. J22TS3]